MSARKAKKRAETPLKRIERIRREMEVEQAKSLLATIGWFDREAQKIIVDDAKRLGLLP